MHWRKLSELHLQPRQDQPTQELARPPTDKNASPVVAGHSYHGLAPFWVAFSATSSTSMMPPAWANFRSVLQVSPEKENCRDNWHQHACPGRSRIFFVPAAPSFPIGKSA